MSRKDFGQGPATGEGASIELTARIAATQRMPLADPDKLGAATRTCSNPECGLTNPIWRRICRFCSEKRVERGGRS